MRSITGGCGLTGSDLFPFTNWWIGSYNINYNNNNNNNNNNLS